MLISYKLLTPNSYPLKHHLIIEGSHVAIAGNTHIRKTTARSAIMNGATDLNSLGADTFEKPDTINTTIPIGGVIAPKAIIRTT